jgi:hypothetical protein
MQRSFTVWSCKYSCVCTSGAWCAIHLQHLTCGQVGNIFPAFDEPPHVHFRFHKSQILLYVRHHISPVYIVTLCRSASVLSSQRYLNIFWPKFWIKLHTVRCGLHVPPIWFSLIEWPQYHVMYNSKYDACHYATVSSVVSFTFKYSIYIFYNISLYVYSHLPTATHQLMGNFCFRIKKSNDFHLLPNTFRFTMRSSLLQSTK